VRRLEARCGDAKRITGETLYRVWRIYMAGSAHSFATGRVNIYQVLFSKPEKGNASKEAIALVT
jgi:cyclopropane-fatty-acyl-phospholipid synthase